VTVERSSSLVDVAQANRDHDTGAIIATDSAEHLTRSRRTLQAFHHNAR
jgi:hypothetical protein